MSDKIESVMDAAIADSDAVRIMFLFPMALLVFHVKSWLFSLTHVLILFILLFADL